MPQHEEITWNVLTHEHKEHTADWYWALGLLTVAGAGISFYFGNLLLGMILIIGAISIVILKIRGPREHGVKLDPRGATLDGTLYPWKSVQSFWIYTDHELAPRLYLTTHSLIMPRIILPLDDASHSQQVRAFCVQYAEEADEDERKPYFLEHIAEIFGL
jgi:hypothetical protein